MRHWLIAPFAATTVFVLAGCGGASTAMSASSSNTSTLASQATTEASASTHNSASTASARSVVPASSSSLSVKDAAFVGLMDEALKVPADRQNAMQQPLITEGHNICAALDAGADLPTIYATLTKTAQSGSLKWSATQMGQLVGASVAAYCPKYNAEVQRQ